MRISDWSSDVCSSDLRRARSPARRSRALQPRSASRCAAEPPSQQLDVYGSPGGRSRPCSTARPAPPCGRGGLVQRPEDRKSVVEGKSVSVRLDLGGRRCIKKKKKTIRVKRTT